MEEQLRRSERLSAVGQLAAGLAHEIRNPLGSLSGAIELLSTDRAFEDEHSRRLFRIVQREAQRLNRLVSEFLEYARTGPGRRETVPLRPLFEEMVQLLRGGEHRAAEVCLEVVEPACALGDPDRLRQVFWNLLLNAAESQARDRRIDVRIRPLPADASGAPRTEVMIEDRGQGIPPEQVEHVFEPFFTTKAKGTGLGLATVHRLVEAAGGVVLLQSEPGRGTLVRVQLPAAEASRVGTGDPVASVEPAAGLP
jgi:signal transduction histidine kinase